LWDRNRIEREREEREREGGKRGEKVGERGKGEVE